MSEKKTIHINPDLFKVSNKNMSRKKQSPIKMKSPEKKQKQKTLRKNVLKMIREKQQEEYKRLFDKPDTNKTRTSSSGQVNTEFNKDFDESLNFFSSLANKPENMEHNATFKKYPETEKESLLLQPNAPFFVDTNENVNIDLPKVFDSFQIKKPSFVLPPPPKYGCLKNGSLPTYKNWHRQTQRIHPSIQVPTIQMSSMQMQSIQPEKQESDKVPFSFLENKESNIFDKFQKKKDSPNIFNEKNKNKIKYRKQKKIFKRTYHVGRSKIKPQIGVLISNRTIRNRISTDAQLLKQTSIKDVRHFLIKKGFIKVGTNAPNDVLRKMYESVSLVCGEIQNHNSENLLFNFIHDTK